MMMMMKSLFAAVFALLMSIAALPAMAQQAAASATPAAAGVADKSDMAKMADGEVRKIDVSQNKLTLKHGEIKKLDMPPMTMVFRIKDAKLFEGLAVGDKVKFAAEQIDGNYVVTQIVKAP
jgi:Cu(I)/Ag(I) efflux system periplasmic protein CusF